jgi:classical protein kinase C
MSHNDDNAVQELIRKIDRENAIINAARQMSQATNNPAVSSRVESQIREATRNINYFEQTLRDIQSRQMGGAMSNLSVSGGGSGPMPPQHGVPQNGQSGRGMNNQSGYGTQQGDYGAPGPGGYSGGAGNGMMPPRAPYAPPGPEERSPRARPNYSKLGKHDIMRRSSHLMLIFTVQI